MTFSHVFRFDNYFCRLDDESGWKIPFGLLGLFTFISFILACVGVSMGNSNSDSIDSLNSDVSSFKGTSKDNPDPDCPYGDVTWGQDPIPGPTASNYYQVVGGTGASITWKAAMRDAQSRCFNNHKVHLICQMRCDVEIYAFIMISLNCMLRATSQISDLRPRITLLHSSCKLRQGS